MKMRIALIAATLLAGLASARADNCGTVESMAGPRGPLHDMPTFDQLNSTCFAHAGVELVQAWLQSHPAIPPPPAPVPLPPGGSGYLPSPLVVAQGIGHEIGRDVTGKINAPGGNIIDAVNYLRKHGSCDQNAIFGSSYKALNSFNEDQLHENLVGFYHHYNDWIRGHLDWLGQRSVDLMARHPDWDAFHINAQAYYDGTVESGAAHELCRSLVGDLPGASLPMIRTGSLEQLLGAMMVTNKTSNDFVDDYFRRACLGHAAPANVPASTELGIDNDKDGLKLINKRLDMPNPQPVGISICAGAFDSGDARLRYLDKSDNGLGCTDKTGHAVVVIGRRRNAANGKCQYLIRNSWGKGCDKYVVAGTGECDANDDIWVNGSLLAPNLFGVTYIGE